MKNHKVSTKKGKKILVEHISKFSESIGYKINIPKKKKNHCVILATTVCTLKFIISI